MKSASRCFLVSFLLSDCSAEYSFAEVLADESTLSGVAAVAVAWARRSTAEGRLW